ncbi:hypothetical protein BC835DRAFT_122256 [Cytidiella melzeri]|nr:hypothetical protein BC835DRAFT_122256 [Cytidiella melzeri]
MAAAPMAVDGPSPISQRKWTASEKHSDQSPSKEKGLETTNGEPHAAEKANAPPVGDSAEPSRNSSTAPEASSATSTQQDAAALRGDKQIKPNKVYIGGLPEHTRKEDLEGCFGKIGAIVNIELKIGYGFVEFDTREAAEESVAKYHEGFFMGNKIRVELSHGGGRTAKYSNDPGACFKCGQVGHWARECPSQPVNGDLRRSAAPLIDRMEHPKDYYPREYAHYDYARLPPRDSRYEYDYPPPPLGRDYRRPASPPRDYRDYAATAARPREDDYRGRPPPMPRLETRATYYPPDSDLPPPGYPRFARDYYDRYDRRPPGDRYAYAPPPPLPRAMSPPPVSARRDDYDRHPRDYPPPSGYRGRPSPPPRYADLPRTSGSEALPRYRLVLTMKFQQSNDAEPFDRRRSQSPPPRSSAGYDTVYPSGGPAYSGTSGNYPGGGYSRDSAPRGASSARDYPPARSRDGDPGYRR